MQCFFYDFRRYLVHTLVHNCISLPLPSCRQSMLRRLLCKQMVISPRPSRTVYVRLRHIYLVVPAKLVLRFCFSSHRYGSTVIRERGKLRVLTIIKSTSLNLSNLRTLSNKGKCNHIYTIQIGCVYKSIISVATALVV